MRACMRAARRQSGTYPGLTPETALLSGLPPDTWDRSADIVTALKPGDVALVVGCVGSAKLVPEFSSLCHCLIPYAIPPSIAAQPFNFAV